MPYQRNSELPPRVKTMFGDAGQTAYRKAFNAAWSGTCRDGGRQGNREGCAHAVATSAAKRTEGTMKSFLKSLFYRPVKKAMKTDGGVQFPAAAYAYVPDAQQPSTWKIRLWETPQKKVTARQVGMAVAALGPGGFRGNRVQIPSSAMGGVKAKVRSAWKSVHGGSDEMPSVLKGEIRVPAGIHIMGNAPVHVENVTVKGVDQPAVQIAKTGRIVKADEEKHVLYVPVLVPDVEDLQGDIVSTAEIEKAQQQFAREYSQGEAELGLDHESTLDRSRAYIVEHWLEKADAEYGEEKVPAGTWMLGVKVLDEELWQSTKAGDRTGASIEGLGIREPA